MVGHVAPEAARGGPLAAVRDGDVITIDTDAGVLERRRRRRRSSRARHGGLGAARRGAPLAACSPATARCVGSAADGAVLGPRVMQALVATPGRRRARPPWRRCPTPRPAAGEVLVRPVEVGVCGTDREISRGLVRDRARGRGAAHPRPRAARPRRARTATASRAATSSPRPCAARAGTATRARQGRRTRARPATTASTASRGCTASPPSSRSCAAEHLVAVPEALGRLGVLAEPASICARAMRHAHAVGGRQPWRPGRALVLRRGRDRDALHRTSCGSRGSTSGPPRSSRPGARRRSSSRRAARATCRRRDAGGRARRRDRRLRRRHRRRRRAPQLSLDALGLLRRGGVALLLGDRRARPRRLAPGPGDRRRRDPRQPRAARQRQRATSSTGTRRSSSSRPPAAAGPTRSTASSGCASRLDDYADAFAFGGVKATLVALVTSDARRIAARSSAPGSRGAITSSRCCFSAPSTSAGTSSSP